MYADIEFDFETVSPKYLLLLPRRLTFQGTESLVATSTTPIRRHRVWRLVVCLNMGARLIRLLCS